MDEKWQQPQQWFSFYNFFFFVQKIILINVFDLIASIGRVRCAYIYYERVKVVLNVLYGPTICRKIATRQFARMAETNRNMVAYVLTHWVHISFHFITDQEIGCKWAWYLRSHSKNLIKNHKFTR